ncbi:MAG: hypothetical protein AAFR35_07230 [Pseudomonadota bacterium]
MLHYLQTALRRQPTAIAQDFAGAAALAVIFVIGIHLPGLV